MNEEDIRDSIDRGWRHWDAIDQALTAGEIDESGWYRAMQAVLVPAYLSATTPQAQSGHSGDETTWKQVRGFVVEAIHRSGTLVDIGCANGHFIETVQRWTAERGLTVEPYGVDLSPDLIELAKTRLPYWKDRLWVGNGLDWIPPFRFDFVHLQEFGYVPAHRRQQLVEHLLRDVCRHDGRLLIGPFNERRATKVTETEMSAWGYCPAGVIERPHRLPEVARRLIWLHAV